MRSLSPRSEENLRGVHPRLVKLVVYINEVIPVEVIEGKRGQERQKWLFETGKTKTMNSLHLEQSDGYAHAVDLVPRPIDWNDKNRFYFMGGVIMACALALLMKVRWGGDWDGDRDFKDQSFNDLVHVELKKE